VIHNEVNILKKLLHHHIISVKGTYMVGQSYFVLLLPVAEQDLREFLKGGYDPTNDPNNEISHMVQNWFGCLARAIKFVHDQEVRHRDIKPDNFVIKRGKIFLVDFGQAKSFAEAQDSTTQGNADYGTHRYLAPEVAYFQQRGRSSDIYSVGCVFLQMFCVLTTGSLSDVEDLCEVEDIKCTSYHGNLDATLDWLSNASMGIMTKIKEAPLVDPARFRLLDKAQVIFQIWRMLQPLRNDRPKAAELKFPSGWCGKCCRSEFAKPDSIGDDAVKELSIPARGSNTLRPSGSNVINCGSWPGVAEPICEFPSR